MKNKKIINLTMAVVMGAGILSGCGNTGDTGAANPAGMDNTTENTTISDTAETTDTPSDTADAAKTDEGEDTDSSGDTDSSENTDTAEDSSQDSASEEEQFSFEEISNLEFWFGSGAGGWCTVLYVHDDGTFEGQYHDSEMGSTGEGYPNGEIYLCDFTGQFTEPQKVNEYTYSMKIESMTYNKEPGTEEIANDFRYIYSEPYGMDESNDFLLYLPGAPLAELPEGYMSWINYTAVNQETDTELPFYGLYNEAPGYGFSSYESTEDSTIDTDTSDADTSDTSDSSSSSIDEELASIEEQAADYNQKLREENLTQTEMNEISGQLYTLWDNELNVIWGYLKETLDAARMDELTIEEREWITEKEDEIEKAGAEYEGGTMQPMVENEKGAELTRARVYELADLLD